MVGVELLPADAVRITILMDNVTDPLLLPATHVERATWFHQLAWPRVSSALSDDGWADALIAEPGFSALVQVTTAERERTIRSTPASVRAVWSRTCADLGFRPGTWR